MYHVAPILPLVAKQGISADVIFIIFIVTHLMSVDKINIEKYFQRYIT